MDRASTSRKSNQCNSDAKLLNEFEVSGNEPGNTFHYANSVRSSKQPVSLERINDYLRKLQRGGCIQSFGCLLAVEETSFQIMAYSENSQSLLGLTANTLLGVDVRKLFTDHSSEYLVAAASTLDVSLTSHVMVVSVTTKRVFYAILHKVDVGIIIDIEPRVKGDPILPDRIGMDAHRVALGAISKLQMNSRGDVVALCDTLVKFIKDLTSYDRVMVYKFYDDEHGEVVSELKRSDLESYLGLHYPATDIPQVARFLYLQSRVRMICNAHADPVGIVQNESLKKPLTLVHSTLRAPHGCHTQYMLNMNSIASLVMAIIINEKNKTKLWGLVSCHHLGPRYIPYPIRCACELIVQTFGSHLGLELQSKLHTVEKKIIKIQVLLCDMVLRDVPFDIVSTSPNITDLVKCSGAAFYYGGVCRVRGVTPTEIQIKELINWLFVCIKDFRVWSTDSLVEVGYPNASALHGICGIAIAHITSKDVVLWFRCASEKQVKWGGAKQRTIDKEEGELMHPRSSFKTLLEVSKTKCFPWETWEIDAISSLRNTIYESLTNKEKDRGEMLIRPVQNVVEKERPTLRVTDVEKMFETTILPIFAIDSTGIIKKWNIKIADLTSLQATQAIGKSMIEFVHDESHAKFKHHLSRGLQGEEGKNIEIRLRNLGKEQNESIFIVANTSRFKDDKENVVCVWFVGQDITEVRNVRSKFARLENDYRAITQCCNPMLPPIFFSDESARCSEWSALMEKLTGWERSEVVGKMIPGEIFGGLCRLKCQDDTIKLLVRFYEAICKDDNETVPFGFFNREGVYTEAILTINKRVDVNGNVLGCMCFLQSLSVTRSSNGASTSSGTKRLAIME